MSDPMAKLRKRVTIYRLLFWVARDFLIAGLLTVLFSGTWLMIPAIFIGIQVLSLCLWLRTVAFDWIFFFLYQRRVGSEFFLDVLKNWDFPRPNAVESVDEYLLRVKQDEHLPMRARMTAVRELSILEYAFRRILFAVPNDVVIRGRSLGLP